MVSLQYEEHRWVSSLLMSTIDADELMDAFQEAVKSLFIPLDTNKIGVKYLVLYSKVRAKRLLLVQLSTGWELWQKFLRRTHQRREGGCFVASDGGACELVRA
jgi:hypothetical protein